MCDELGFSCCCKKMTHHDGLKTMGFCYSAGDQKARPRASSSEVSRRECVLPIVQPLEAVAFLGWRPSSSKLAAQYCLLSLGSAPSHLLSHALTLLPPPYRDPGAALGLADPVASATSDAEKRLGPEG